jgi:Translation initiation factor SUI1
MGELAKELRRRYSASCSVGPRQGSDGATSRKALWSVQLQGKYSEQVRAFLMERGVSTVKVCVLRVTTHSCCYTTLRCCVVVYTASIQAMLYDVMFATRAQLHCSNGVCLEVYNVCSDSAVMSCMRLM